MEASAAPVNGFDFCPSCGTLLGKRDDFAKQLGVEKVVRCNPSDGCDHKLLKISCEKCKVVNFFRGV